MRKWLFVVVALLVFGSTANAQEAAVGFKGGVNFANLSFDADEADVSFDQRIGFVGGLFVVWPASGPIALQTEVLYAQKGATIEEGSASGTIELDFIEIPILLRASSTPSSGGVSFHVFGGPSLGFRVRAHAESTFDGQTEEEDLDDEVESFDFGLVAGAGLEVGRFVVDGRYTWGLSNLNKEDEEDVKIRSRVVSVMAGVRF